MHNILPLSYINLASSLALFCSARFPPLTQAPSFLLSSLFSRCVAGSCWQTRYGECHHRTASFSSSLMCVGLVVVGCMSSRGSNTIVVASKFGIGLPRLSLRPFAVRCAGLGDCWGSLLCVGCARWVHLMFEESVSAQQLDLNECCKLLCFAHSLAHHIGQPLKECLTL